MQERQIIQTIQSRLSPTNQHVICGIGDDCAVFPSNNNDWLISTDTLVEGHHFDLRWHPPHELGCKCLAVNISDIAAMGGAPMYATISLTFTPQLTDSWFESFIDGIVEMHSAYNIALIGGDTVLGEKLSVTVTIIGQAKERIVYRGGATDGDSIYVSGYLGSAGGGLYLFKKLYESTNVADQKLFSELQKLYAPLMGQHLQPEPQVALGEVLAATGNVSAMQDISDGVATDLSHIAAKSGVGALLYAQDLPVVPELRLLAKTYGLSVTDLALTSGDDYQLLFTVKSGCEQQVELAAKQANGKIFKIGICDRGEGVRVVTPSGGTERVTFGGFEHK